MNAVFIVNREGFCIGIRGGATGLYVGWELMSGVGTGYYYAYARGKA